MLTKTIKRRTIIFWIFLSWLAIPVCALRIASERILSGISWWINGNGSGFGASASSVASTLIDSVEKCCQMSQSTSKCSSCGEHLFMLDMLDMAHNRKYLPFPLTVSCYQGYRGKKSWKPSKSVSMGGPKLVSNSDTGYRSRQLYEKINV